MFHVLITGGSGFIGQHLARALRAAGYDVTALVRRTSNTHLLTDLNVRLVPGDVCHADSLPAALDGVDAVCHLAGRTRAFSYEHFAEVNVTGCQNLARECAAQTGPPRLVIVSSLAAGGPSLPPVPRSETDADAPISNYGRSKLAGERVALEFTDQVPITIVRPSAVFGPGDRNGLTIFRTIRRTGWHIVSRRDLPLSIIYVKDLATVLTRLLERDPFESGERFYVANPNPTTYTELGRLAAEAMGCTFRLLRIRRGWFYVVAAYSEVTGRLTGSPALVGFDKLRELTAPAWVCDPSKLQTELDFIPSESLAERFGETAAWYASQRWV